MGCFVFVVHCLLCVVCRSFLFVVCCLLCIACCVVD